MTTLYTGTVQAERVTIRRALDIAWLEARPMSFVETKKTYFNKKAVN